LYLTNNEKRLIRLKPGLEKEALIMAKKLPGPFHFLIAPLLPLTWLFWMGLRTWKEMDLLGYQKIVVRA